MPVEPVIVTSFPETRPWDLSAKRLFTIFASRKVRPSTHSAHFDFGYPTSWLHDLIVAEDDAYFILQLGEYVPKSQRMAEYEDKDVARFVASLVPSYLRIDTQGRALRMDTFSKVASLRSF